MPRDRPFCDAEVAIGAYPLRTSTISVGYGRSRTIYPVTQ